MRAPRFSRAALGINFEARAAPCRAMYLKNAFLFESCRPQFRARTRAASLAQSRVALRVTIRACPSPYACRARLIFRMTSVAVIRFFRIFLAHGKKVPVERHAGGDDENLRERAAAAAAAPTGPSSGARWAFSQVAHGEHGLAQCSSMTSVSWRPRARAVVATTGSLSVRA